MVDISNMRFGRLVAIEPTKIDNKTKWKCICDCGNICYYGYHPLKSGNNSSCGCMVKEKQHGFSKTRLYDTWCNMKSRCHNPKNNYYYNYGAKGTSVCDEWRYNFIAFKDWALNNGYNDDLTIDRIDNSKGYSPDNCRFADDFVQANNTTRNHKMTYNGITKTMSEWSNDLDISYTTLRKRLNDGWTVEDAIEKPMIKSNIREEYHKSFTFEKKDIMYFNTRFGKFSCQTITSFFGLDKTTINKHITYHLDRSADEVLDFYLKKKNKTIEELLDYNNAHTHT